MDYKYIEQLLQRYWDCETTVQEESILHNFFAQDDVPAHLLPYQDIFKSLEDTHSEQLSKDFDERILSMIEKKENVSTVKARRIRFGYSFHPFLKAAAMVAIVLTVSLAVQQAMYHEQAGNVVTLPPAVVPGAQETALEKNNNPQLTDSLVNLSGKEKKPTDKVLLP